MILPDCATHKDLYNGEIIGYHRGYATRKEAIKDITEYIEVFYNRQRIQEKLNYLSPAQYLRQFYIMRQVA